jgi:hypothetical protein
MTRGPRSSCEGDKKTVRVQNGVDFEMSYEGVHGYEDVHAHKGVLTLVDNIKASYATFDLVIN